MKLQFALLLLISTTANAQQRALTPADISAPQFEARVVEITTTRLQQIEASFKEDPQFNAQVKNYEAALKAHRDWTKCKSDVEGALKPGPAKAASQEADAKKLAEEAQRRIKEAKSPAEMQQIAMEMMAKQKEMNKPMMQAYQKHDEQIAAKCGAEPPRPTSAPERKNAPGGLAYYNTLDRATAFCQVGPVLVGRDGSVGIDPKVYQDMAGNTDFGPYVYSKAEAAVLEKACPRLNPILIENGWNWK